MNWQARICAVVTFGIALLSASVVRAEDGLVIPGLESLPSAEPPARQPLRAGRPTLRDMRAERVTRDEVFEDAQAPTDKLAPSERHLFRPAPVKENDARATPSYRTQPNTQAPLGGRPQSSMQGQPSPRPQAGLPRPGTQSKQTLNQPGIRRDPPQPNNNPTSSRVDPRASRGDWQGNQRSNPAAARSNQDTGRRDLNQPRLDTPTDRNPRAANPAQNNLPRKPPTNAQQKKPSAFSPRAWLSRPTTEQR